MSDIVETTENTELSTKTQTVANIVVLSCAIVGAIQTTKFAVNKVQSGIRLLKEARQIEHIEDLVMS